MLFLARACTRKANEWIAAMSGCLQTSRRHDRHEKSFQTEAVLGPTNTYLKCNACFLQVVTSDVNWEQIANMESSNLQPVHVMDGLTTFSLPEGLTALVVDSPEAVPKALEMLTSSMEDNVIAIDLEWRHARNGRPGLVALIQVSSHAVFSC